MIAEAGAFYVVDRAYIDFHRLHRLNKAGSFIVIPAKPNLQTKRRYTLGGLIINYSEQCTQINKTSVVRRQDRLI